MARRVASEEELEHTVDDLREEGWSLKEKSANRAVLKKSDYGSLGAHILIGLLTIWWTFGFGNLVYAAKRFWMNSKTRVVRVKN